MQVRYIFVYLCKQLRKSKNCRTLMFFFCLFFIFSEISYGPKGVKKLGIPQPRDRESCIDLRVRFVVRSYLILNMGLTWCWPLPLTSDIFLQFYIHSTHIAGIRCLSDLWLYWYQISWSFEWTTDCSVVRFDWESQRSRWNDYFSSESNLKKNEIGNGSFEPNWTFVLPLQWVSLLSTHSYWAIEYYECLDEYVIHENFTIQKNHFSRSTLSISEWWWSISLSLSVSIQH